MTEINFTISGNPDDFDSIEIKHVECAGGNVRLSREAKQSNTGDRYSVWYFHCARCDTKAWLLSGEGTAAIMNTLATGEPCQVKGGSYKSLVFKKAD